ncbi:hypothetical protein HDU91_002340, partial [Kappamyces sp. JEL0680]
NIPKLPNASVIVDGIAKSLGHGYYFALPMAALLFIISFFIVEKPMSGKPEVVMA